MRAATHETYGTPDVLTLSEVPRPTIGDHELLVEVRASVVTHGDRRLRAADFPGVGLVVGRLMFGILRPRHRVPGTMFAGRVVAVGKAVTRFAAGDDVFGSCDRGAQAEYLAVRADKAVARMPEGIDYAEAAALPYGAGTAVVFLRDLAKVQPGERVLIVGASGGVGRFAVQLAHHLGAEVTGVCSRDHELVRELGATHVIDRTVADYTEGEQRYDVILDTSPKSRFCASRKALAPKGRYLQLHMSMGLLFMMAMTALFGGRRALTGVALSNRELVDDVRELADQGALRAVIARRFPLERIAEAHAFLESGHPRGGVVIDVAPATERPLTARAGLLQVV